jgi:hypothetical protein
VVAAVGSGSIITRLQKVAQAESDWSSGGENYVIISVIILFPSSVSCHLSCLSAIFNPLCSADMMAFFHTSSFIRRDFWNCHP